MTDDIVLKGLSTRSERNALNYKPELETKYGIYAVTITVKSNIFHKSLRYELLLKIKPIAIIFKTASNV